MRRRSERNLEGRVALLSGAAGGIGAAFARALVRRGASLAMVDRDGEGLARLAAELRREAPSQLISEHVFDLRAVEELPALVEAVERAHGGISLLINNAGLTVHGRFADMALAQIDTIVDVDLRAALHLTHACLPALRRASERSKGSASVLLVSSMAGLLAFPYQSVYSAAKQALRGFGAALRVELGAEGIGVTTVLPGTTATGFLAAAESHDARMSQRMASLMQRFGTSPEHVVELSLRALAANRGEVQVGWDCHLTGALSRLSPRLLPSLLATAFRLYHRWGAS